MIYELPLTDDGDRSFSCKIGSATYLFRTYYVNDGWLMDIYDDEENPLKLGIRITGGANLLKGCGNLFRGIYVGASLERGKESDMDALGDTLKVYWFTEDEEQPQVGDPMNNINVVFGIL